MTDELFDLEGRTALVTGGSRGIGLMVAEAYVRRGVRVYVSSRKEDACREVAERLSSFGSCVALPADVSTDDGCRSLVSDLSTHESTLDILVNNAGATWGAPLEEHDEQAWERVMALNVKGLFHLTRHALPMLRSAATPDHPARVINIGSIDGLRVPATPTYAYSASKAAVHQLTRHLAVELAPAITVNAIAPGPFESKMMAATLREHGDAIVAMAPMQRIGRPEDIAGLAIFLASRGASYLTGTVLPVDGGISIRP